MINETTIRAFNSTALHYYKAHGRHDLPWRLEEEGGFNAYNILVSEIMLQQTQVPRVIPKYIAFLVRFPDVATLAKAPLGDVLTAWNGLGYNRRAKFLWQTAQAIINEHKGVFPDSAAQLVEFPGIGANTAGAILAYAYNQPAIFIETNIRTVFIHHFFPNVTAVSDTAIAELLTVTLDYENPRQYYWALMDYGSYLKQAGVNRSAQSKSYTKQSAFKGSRRQIRGQIIRILTAGPQTRQSLLKSLPDERANSVVDELLREGLVRLERGRLAL